MTDVVIFREQYACGHSGRVEHLGVTLGEYAPSRIGQTVRCWDCPTHGGAVTLVVIDDVWVMVAPGSYADQENALHLDAVEVCEAVGVEATQENQQMLVDAELAGADTELEVRQAAAPESVARSDAVTAAADLVARCGAAGFEMGYLRDPDEPEFLTMGPGWYASALLRGARIMMDEQRLPEYAADGLAHRILDGGECTHCGEKTSTMQTNLGVYLHSGRSKKARCIWYRVGARWERGCEAP